MCGRYCYESKTKKYIEELTGDDLGAFGIGPAGDIYPSMESFTISGQADKLKAGLMTWGFPMSGSKQLVINARAETALTKPMFSDSVMRRRCIIPASHFYEWDREKNKATFTWEGRDNILMLGFFNDFDLVNRFVILTTAANESMIQTHDRMPLIIDESRIEEWILDDSSVKHFLAAGSPMLKKYQEYEQMRFF